MRALLPFLFLFAFAQANAQFILRDKFNRDLNGNTIVLTDWEGYMANPAIQLTLEPLPATNLPVTVTLTANHPRLYFNTPSAASAAGPSKTLTFTNAGPLTFFLSVFPDRAGGDEAYTLTLNSAQGNQAFSISVKDEDPAAPVVNFNIILDFSKDVTYNFFNTQARIDKATEAANDWAYFLQNMNFNQVPALNEFTYIWNDNYASGNFTQNASAYTGFLLYCYGIHVNPHISGGSPSTSNFQHIGGVTTTLRRSGSYNVDPHGNYNTLGWSTSYTDDTWFLASNLGGDVNDLYSIALHEIGHALTFNGGYPIFQTWKTQGFINDPAVVAYYGGTVPVNASEHLSNGPLLVDRLSKKGLFGSEYANEVPYGRWLITKLNLMVMDAVGYDVKQTSCFLPVTIPTNTLPNGLLFENYSSPLAASGGIPFYKFEVQSGNLPPGLSLNSFTGQITGLPNTAGVYNFTVQVTDYDNLTAQKALTLTISDNCVPNLTVSGALTAPLYKATGSVSTLNVTTVGNGANVLCKAGVSVDLNPEFEVQAGGALEVVMEACTVQ